VRRGPSALLAAVLVGVTPSALPAQVFLASAPFPDFTVGPLVVAVNVRRDLTPVTVNLTWSLTPARGRRAADIKQDLHLLWPSDVAESTAPGAADPTLARYVEARGFDVVGSGRLLLRSRDRMQLGTAFLGDPVDTAVSYVNFARRGQPLTQAGPAAYVKIPWTPKLADPLSVVTLSLPVRGHVTPKAATWVDELFWGRRYLLTAGFGGPGPLALPLFPLYFEHRDRVVHLAREFSMVVANFADADHLRIEEVAPAAATRRPSLARAGAEIVSLPLVPSEGLTPQALRVQFRYFSGRINWRPVVVSAVLLLLGNFAGVLILGKDVSRRIRRRRRARRRSRTTAASPNGTVPSRETLAALVPGTTTYDEVVARCGRPDEEAERVAPAGRRTLVYRATVGTGDPEEHEVEIRLELDCVREVLRRVRRR
jgi:hypothetical protein